MNEWDGQMGLFEDNPLREVPQGKRVVVFDLETQRSFDEVGGRSQFHRLGVSVGVAYRYDEARFITYHEETVGELIELLKSAELVVGYNILGFDYQVLRGYTDEDLRTLPTFDIMYDLEERLGFRPKLESVAAPTLGRGKSADGLQSLEWVRQGRMDLVRDYCIQDVTVTRDLFLFGLNEGYLSYRDKRRGKVRLDVDWNLEALVTAAGRASGRNGES